MEIRKFQDNYIKENILQLYKKSCNKKYNKNNLYNAAKEVGVEPNIIVEFARIFGFEVDFQRDIRKGDCLKLYEKFEDDNKKTKDTGKIIYASMYVNGEEIIFIILNLRIMKIILIVKAKYYKIFNENSNNGARLSSSFGMRKHPILGYNKMHRELILLLQLGHQLWLLIWYSY